jgi:hypothetical protein
VGGVLRARPAGCVDATAHAPRTAGRASGLRTLTLPRASIGPFAPSPRLPRRPPGVAVAAVDAQLKAALATLHAAGLDAHATRHVCGEMEL